MIYSANNRSFILDLNKSWAEQTPVPLPDPPDGNTFVVWDWSQDGDKVAGTFSAGTRGIGFYSFSTNAFSKLAEIPETDPLSIPSWLPDSRHIVFTKSNKILVVDVETGKTREIFAPKGGEVRSPFVSRDGRLLYYSLHINESDIWLLDNSRQE
jgi:Tol biopolymer transport system component